MYRFLSVLSLFILLYGCQSTGEATETTSFIYTDIGAQETGGVKGTVRDKTTGEPLAFATVKAMLNDELVAGANTDFDGQFQIMPLKPGTYDIVVEYLGFSPLRVEGIEVKAGKLVEISGELLEIEDNIEVLKPMIYLYPETETEVEVKLNYDGVLTHTYPKSDGNWTVTATPDGTLTDANGRQYYGLFWEGKPNDPIQPTCGTVVSNDSLVSFLESSLDQLGLNYKEANEFIVFWLPILEQNPYNLIYFAGSDYTNHAELNISPKPDNLIRVMMGYVPLQNPIEIDPQILPEKPIRSGFTVVEWGGTKCSLPNS